MSKILSAADILAAVDVRTETVGVPEWGGSVIVRTMNGLERDQFDQGLYKVNGDKREVELSGLRSKLVALTAVDENGDRLFAIEQIEALSKKSAAALDRVFVVAQRLNGMSGEAIEVAAKNSATDPSAGSPTA